MVELGLSVGWVMTTTFYTYSQAYWSTMDYRLGLHKRLKVKKKDKTFLHLNFLELFLEFTKFVKDRLIMMRSNTNDAFVFDISDWWSGNVVSSRRSLRWMSTRKSTYILQ